MPRIYSIVALLLVTVSWAWAFVPLASQQTVAFSTRCFMSDDSQNDDPNDIIAKRIIVTGDVQGGYYRSCILNEVGYQTLKLDAIHRSSIASASF